MLLTRLGYVATPRTSLLGTDALQTLYTQEPIGKMLRHLLERVHQLFRNEKRFPHEGDACMQDMHASQASGAGSICFAKKNERTAAIAMVYVALELNVQ